jgi:hypothetical protein
MWTDRFIDGSDACSRLNELSDEYKQSPKHNRRWRCIVPRGYADHGPARLLAMLAEQSILVEGVSFESGKASDAEPTRKMQIRVKLPRAFDHKHCLSLLTNDPSVLSFDLS